jgi:hypothetical protein
MKGGGVPQRGERELEEVPPPSPPSRQADRMEKKKLKVRASSREGAADEDVTLLVSNETPYSRDSIHDIQDLKNAGFLACDLKNAGCEIHILKAAGFTLKELTRAGFDASAFKGCTDFSVEDLKTEFTPLEMKQAGFDFSALKAAG